MSIFKRQQGSKGILKRVSEATPRLTTKAKCLDIEDNMNSSTQIFNPPALAPSTATYDSSTFLPPTKTYSLPTFVPSAGIYDSSSFISSTDIYSLPTFVPSAQ